MMMKNLALFEDEFGPRLILPQGPRDQFIKDSVKEMEKDHENDEKYRMVNHQREIMAV